MIISHLHKFIFIHVPKVAGTSIENVLVQYLSDELTAMSETELLKHANTEIPPHDFPRHATCREIRRKLPEAMFSGYFKFAFVRCPYDWVVSNYFYFLQSDEYKDNAVRELVRSRSFEEVVTFFIVNKGQAAMVDGMKFNQKEFLYGENGDLLVDYVGKYENLQQDFRTVCQHLGIGELALPHANKTDHRHFRTYYTPGSRDLVYDALREDFDAFGYSKDF